MRLFSYLKWRVLSLWLRLTRSSAARRQQLWFVRDVEMPVTAPSINVRFREIPHAEQEVAYARFRIAPTELIASVPRRFFAGFIGEEMVYRMWAFEPNSAVLHRLPDNLREVASRALVVDACFTPPAYRGRSIYAAALEWLSRHVRAEGISYLILEVGAGNVASIRGIGKAGFVAANRFQPLRQTTQHR